MTHASLRSVAIAALMSCASTALAADPQGPPPPGSLGTWVQGCEADAPDLQAALADSAAIIRIESIQQNLNGTFSIVNQPFTENAAAQDVCSTSFLYGDPQVMHTPFRSAFQVGPDLILTAWHSTVDPLQMQDYVVVFGLHSREVGDTCVPASFDGLPGDRLFTISEVVADGHPTGTPGLDFALLRLDRTIDTTYARVRRSGQGWPGDSVTVIGHPERTAARVDTAGVAGTTGLTVGGREFLWVANVHMLVSSSGSMLYNRTQRTLETSINNGGNAWFVDPLSPGGEPQCKVIAHVDRWSGPGVSLRYFADNIPAFELIVDSLDPVPNATTVGGGLPNPSTSRDVIAPSTATGPIAYQIVPPPPFEAGQPTLTITPGAPLTGTLAPGDDFTIQEQAHIHGVSCGRYERSYQVRDLTHGYTDTARHLFEIGLREFTVAPLRGWVVEDVAPPYENTQVFTVANPRLDAVDVVVSASQSWATLNGSAGPVTLHVEPGQQASVTVGIAAAFQPASLPQTLNAVLSFDFASGTSCPAFDDPITRNLNVTIGREIFTGTVGALPQGVPQDFTANVPESFCVGDVDVRVDVKSAPADEISAAVVNPTGTAVTVWNQGSLLIPDPGSSLNVTLDDEADEPQEHLPYSPLSAFDNAPGGGLWHFIVTDEVPKNPGTLASWSLVLTAKTCP